MRRRPSARTLASPLFSVLSWATPALRAVVPGLAALTAALMTALMTALVPVTTAHAGPTEDAVTEAIGRYGRGDIEGARQAFEALAGQGVPAADYNLALMHLNGDLPGGAEAALGRMTRAAEAGFVTAMYGIGELYEQGRLGKPDLERAFAWHLRAAVAGSVDGQVAVGTAYYLGRGAAKDMPQAAHWYREAAKGGDVGAQYLIASMYETGLGVERDLRLARYWYEAAAENGDIAAAAKVEELDKRLKDGRDCKAPAAAPAGSDADC
jgi:uncharacterized protein